jgi:hypothetical protein
MSDFRALITDKVKGKTIDFLGIQGDCLIIATTDGQSFRIGWRDDTNTLVPGEPSLEGVDMRIMIDAFGAAGGAGL